MIARAAVIGNASAKVSPMVRSPGASRAPRVASRVGPVDRGRVQDIGERDRLRRSPSGRPWSRRATSAAPVRTVVSAEPRRSALPETAAAAGTSPVTFGRMEAAQVVAAPRSASRARRPGDGVGSRPITVAHSIVTARSCREGVGDRVRADGAPRRGRCRGRRSASSAGACRGPGGRPGRRRRASASRRASSLASTVCSPGARRGPAIRWSRRRSGRRRRAGCRGGRGRSPAPWPPARPERRSGCRRRSVNRAVTVNGRPAIGGASGRSRWSPVFRANRVCWVDGRLSGSQAPRGRTSHRAA